MTNERRKVPRHNLVHYLQVYDQETENVLGRVVDLSERGMQLVGERPYDAELGPRRLRMVLPPSFEGKRHVDFEAEFRWGGQDVNADLFDGGFEFVNRVDDLKDTLDLVIDQLSFHGRLDEDDD